MEITGNTLAGGKSASKPATAVASSAAEATTAAAAGCETLATRVPHITRTRTGATAESGMSGATNSSVRAIRVKPAASAGSAHLLAGTFVSRERSATAHGHGQACSEHPAHGGVGIAGERSPVRGHPRARRGERGRGTTAFDRETAHLELEGGGEVAQLHAGRLCLVASDGDKGVLHRAVSGQLEPSGQRPALSLHLKVDYAAARAGLGEQRVEFGQGGSG